MSLCAGQVEVVKGEVVESDLFPIEPGEIGEIKEDRWVLTPRQERATKIAGLLIAHVIVGVSRAVRWGVRSLREALSQLAEQGRE